MTRTDGFFALHPEAPVQGFLHVLRVFATWLERHKRGEAVRPPQATYVLQNGISYCGHLVSFQEAGGDGTIWIQLRSPEPSKTPLATFSLSHLSAITLEDGDHFNQLFTLKPQVPSKLQLSRKAQELAAGWSQRIQPPWRLEIDWASQHQGSAEEVGRTHAAMALDSLDALLTRWLRDDLTVKALETSEVRTLLLSFGERLQCSLEAPVLRITLPESAPLEAHDLTAILGDALEKQL